jgi:hypothetical protein
MCLGAIAKNIFHASKHYNVMYTSVVTGLLSVSGLKYLKYLGGNFKYLNTFSSSNGLVNKSKAKLMNIPFPLLYPKTDKS